MAIEFIEKLKEEAKKKDARIAFNEIEDKRILEAVIRIDLEKIARPVLVGKKSILDEKLVEFNLDLPKSIEVIDMDNFDNKDLLIEEFCELRKNKGMTIEKSKEIIESNSMYFSNMLLKLGFIDGLVSGAVHSTGDVIRPALQIIKTEKKGDVVSTFFLMIKDDEQLLFSDCGLNIKPNPEELAKIAKSTYNSAKNFGITPKLAFLSFSTKGSAKHADVNSTIEAGEIFHKENPELVEHSDYELQFDAAYVPEVQKKKAPNSSLAGNTNVFIFPDLNSGNISYKIAQRLGGYLAIGPLIQGLAKPVNDLSRGCNVDEIITACTVTALGVKKNTDDKKEVLVNVN